MTKSNPAPSTRNLDSANQSLEPWHVGLLLLDTAWRIATPVLILAIIGIILDRHYKSGPWLTLLGMVLGFGVAALLIRRLLASNAGKEKK